MIKMVHLSSITLSIILLAGFTGQIESSFEPWNKNDLKAFNSCASNYPDVKLWRDYSGGRTYRIEGENAEDVMRCLEEEHRWIDLGYDGEMEPSY